MPLLNFKRISWPGFLLALTFFLTGLTLLSYPGFQNDEVIFAGADFQYPGSSIFGIGLFHRRIPLMHLTYLGSLKSWLYAPILAFLPPTAWAIRLPVLAIGALTVWIVAVLFESIHSRRAAWIGGLLLATDTIFLLTTCFDWGPVAFQHFFLAAGMLLVWRFVSTTGSAALFCGFLCFGLGLWDKALFLWIFGGLILATLVVFPRQLLKRITPRNVGVAVGGLALGSLPLIAFNVLNRFATFRSNSSFSFAEFASKIPALRGTWNGSALLGYLAANPDQPGQALPPQNIVESTSFVLHSVFGDHLSNQLTPALLIALLLVPLLWRTKVRKLLLFCIVTMAVAWFQMAITKGAGGSAHHIVLLWPIPHLLIGAAFAEASLRLRTSGAILVAVAALYLAGENLLLTNQYLYQFFRYGSPHAWTDAIVPLSTAVDRMGPAQIVIDDWGLIDPLILLHHGKLKASIVDNSFLSAAEDDNSKKWDLDRLERGLWLGHTPAYEEITGINDSITKAADAAGFRKQVVEVIHDRHGRPVFEMFRFVRAG